MPGTHLRSLAAMLVLTTVAVACTQQTTEPSAATGSSVDLTTGAELFLNNCARCHGVAADGTDSGPSFLDRVYEPSHHADEAFQIAAARGVQPHHWNFGPMPAIGTENGLDRAQVAEIIAYVRSLQRAAGIN